MEIIIHELCGNTDNHGILKIMGQQISILQTEIYNVELKRSEIQP